MMEIDARGLSCPEPVLMVRKSIKADENEYLVRVDNPAAYENATRFLENQGFLVTALKNGAEYTLKAVR